MSDSTSTKTKEEKLQQVKKYLLDEGFSVDDLKDFQQSRHEPENAEEAAGPTPGELEGVPPLTPEAVVAELMNLKRRVNNFFATHHPEFQQ